MRGRANLQRLQQYLGNFAENQRVKVNCFRISHNQAANRGSVALGDWNADPDQIFLVIYDATDTLLGYTSFLRASDSHEMNTLSLSGSNIACAVFGTNIDDPGFIVADNFTFGSGVALVPLSTGGLLLLSGLGAGVLMRRKRKA